MYSFEYERPKGISEAVGAVGEDDKFLAGGQSFLPTLKLRLAQVDKLVDLGSIAELKGITVSGNEVSIGAMTTHATVASSADVKSSIPALAHLAAHIGDAQVRNRGTIGGSIANNDPAADYPSALVALGATVHTNNRTIAAEDFFVDLFETALEEGELITKVTFPIAEKAATPSFQIRHPGLHLSVSLLRKPRLVSGLLSLARVHLSSVKETWKQHLIAIFHRMPSRGLRLTQAV